MLTVNTEDVVTTGTVVRCKYRRGPPPFEPCARTRPNPRRLTDLVGHSAGRASGARTHDLTDYERTLRRRNTPLPATTVALPASPVAPDITGSRAFAPRTAPRRSGLAGTVATGSTGPALPEIQWSPDAVLGRHQAEHLRPMTCSIRAVGVEERDRVVGDVAAAAVRPVLSGPVGGTPTTGDVEQVQIVGHLRRVSAPAHHPSADKETGAGPGGCVRLASSALGHQPVTAWAFGPISSVAPSGGGAGPRAADGATALGSSRRRARSPDPNRRRARTGSARP
jgi:hypothetical protein